MNLDWDELVKGFEKEAEGMPSNNTQNNTASTAAPTTNTNTAAPASGNSTPMSTQFGQGLKAGVGKGLSSFPPLGVATLGANLGTSAAQSQPFDAIKQTGKLALRTGGALMKAPGVINNFLDKVPGWIDNIGTVAPLAIGALAMSGMNRGGQGGGAGQPVVVNNYMGQKPNMLSPQSGVHSLADKMGSLNPKLADVISKALADAAKRRMANKVLDVVTPEDKAVEEKPEELEITTKYPEMAKLLEDEHNKAYLQRLLQT